MYLLKIHLFYIDTNHYFFRFQYNGCVYFNLADVEVNGKSILPEVKHQRRQRKCLKYAVLLVILSFKKLMVIYLYFAFFVSVECTSYALAHAQEFNDIVENIILDDGSPIDAVDPMVLADTYNMMFGENKNRVGYSGLHKMLYTGLILKEYSRRTVKVN